MLFGSPRNVPRPPSRPSRDVNLFCYRKGIVDFNAKVSDGTFDHCVAEQKLHGVSRQAELDRLMVVLDFQADLNCLQQQAWQRRGQERAFLAELSAGRFVIWAKLFLPNGGEHGLGRGMLLWILGVPIPIIILLALFWHN
jgi:hypothetical protein